MIMKVSMEMEASGLHLMVNKGSLLLVAMAYPLV